MNDDLPVLTESQWNSQFGGSQDALPVINESDWNRQFATPDLPGGGSTAGAIGFGRGASLGLLDEASAGWASGMGSIFDSLGIPHSTEAPKYDDVLNQVRGLERTAQEKHPIATGVGQVGGGLALMPLVPSLVASAEGGAVLPAMAAEGGLWGMGYGFGEGEGGFQNRLANAGKSGLVSEIASPALGALLMLPGAAKSGVERLIGPQSEDAASRKVAEMAQRLGIDPAELDAKIAALAGDPLAASKTTAEVLQSPELSILEQQAGTKMKPLEYAAAAQKRQQGYDDLASALSTVRSAKPENTGAAIQADLGALEQQAASSLDSGLSQLSAARGAVPELTGQSIQADLKNLSDKEAQALDAILSQVSPARGISREYTGQQVQDVWSTLSKAEKDRVSRLYDKIPGDVMADARDVLSTISEARGKYFGEGSPDVPRDIAGRLSYLKNAAAPPEPATMIGDVPYFIGANGKLTKEVPPGGGEVSLRGLQNARSHLGEMAQDAFARGNNRAGALASEVQAAIADAIENAPAGSAEWRAANDAYKAYAERYASGPLAKLGDALPSTVTEKILGSPEAAAQATRGLNPQALAALKDQIASDLAGMTDSQQIRFITSNEGALKNLLGPDFQHLDTLRGSLAAKAAKADSSALAGFADVNPSSLYRKVLSSPEAAREAAQTLSPKSLQAVKDQIASDLAGMTPKERLAFIDNKEAPLRAILGKDFAHLESLRGSLAKTIEETKISQLAKVTSGRPSDAFDAVLRSPESAAEAARKIGPQGMTAIRDQIASDLATMTDAQKVKFLTDNESQLKNLLGGDFAPLAAIRDDIRSRIDTQKLANVTSGSNTALKLSSVVQKALTGKDPKSRGLWQKFIGGGVIGGAALSHPLAAIPAWLAAEGVSALRNRSNGMVQNALYDALMNPRSMSEALDALAESGRSGINALAQIPRGVASSSQGAASKEQDRAPVFQKTTSSPNSPPNPAQKQAKPDAQAVMDVLYNAVRHVESSDGKKLIGPPTKYGTAKGPVQFLDSTGLEYHDKLKIPDPYNPFDEDQAKKLFAAKMADLLRRYHGDLEKALTAYHSGEKNVDEGTLGPKGRTYAGLVLAALRGSA